ncbi:general secretion pathway protein GspB [uncultured Vibrio sp.]|uniref:general secretion pathway protein GspB n=1 Tax=uncultured Vibrio sp. TaxID=114054 RepID=UPI0029C908D8|nr:general secretion pathway protein GspB [uncultured Vibrio sp.]
MSIAKHASLLLLPIGISAVGAVWYLEKQPLKTQAATPVVVADAVQPFEVLNYPEINPLSPLPREWPSAELSDDIGTYLQPEEYASSSQDAESPATQNQARDEELDFSLDDIDLSSLSPDLAMKVENALSRRSEETTPQRSAYVNDLEGNAQRWQGRLPALNLQTHMYASDAERRWVKINDVEYHQGEVVDGQITLKEIQPQAVIVEFQGEQIRIPALYEWEG